ncbi:MAG: GDP-mannose 4,6-dehydratase [Candidatus Methanomethylicaceae archaeon]
MFIKRAVLEGLPPVIFGDGRQTRDYIYVKDLVKFHNMLIESDYGNLFEPYNLGGGSSVSIRDLARLVIDLSGISLEPIFEDPPEGGYSSITDRRRIPRELKNLHLDIPKAMKAGWKAETPLREGILREIEQIRSNPERWNVKERV